MRRSKSDSDSDPIDSITRTRAISLRSDTTSRRSILRPEAGSSRRVPVTDGPATKRRQQKHELKSTTTSTVDLTQDGGSDNDSIQSASGFDEPFSNRRSSPHIPSGSVAKRVTLWENKAKPSPVSTRARSPTKLSTDNVPHVNLTTVKSKMRPRLAPHVRDTSSNC